MPVVYICFLADFRAICCFMDIVIVLTDREESALLGAYETVSAETPLVISDTETMRYYFPMGAVFVRNDKEKIKEGIETALAQKEKLAEEIKELKKIKLYRQRENFSRIDTILRSK